MMDAFDADVLIYAGVAGHLLGAAGSGAVPRGAGGVGGSRLGAVVA
jgi:hypothetical protein